MGAFYVVVKNTGEPSIAENWSAKILIPGQDAVQFMLQVFDDESCACRRMGLACGVLELADRPPLHTYERTTR